MTELQTADLIRTIDELSSRESIRETLYRYARGIDRKDAEEVKRSFWPDSRVDFGIYQGSGQEFASLIGGWFSDGGVDITAHLVGNIIILLDGDIANSECYLHAAHRVKRDGATIDCFVGARYQDRFERRNNEWKIAERVLIYDWFREYPDTGDFEAGSAMGFNAGNSVTGMSGPDRSPVFAQALARKA
jgi:hypothetical protein